MIEATGLTKRYGDKVAVDHLSFRVEPGRVTGFLGPNGAGKSTTMRLMLGLAAPTAGRVLIEGRPYRDLRPPLRHVGAMLEGTGAHPGRSGYSHLLWLARSNRIPQARVRETLATVGLAAAARKRAGNLSLGMAQRLGIAAALLGDPAVLILDEPLNGLDPEGIRWARELMRALAAQGRTVLVSSHLMNEMAVTADRIIVISRGRLLADTTAAGFAQAHAGSYVLVRTPQPERMRSVLTSAGIEVRDAPGGTLHARGAGLARIGELAAANGLTVHEISASQGSLEDAFLRLTGDPGGPAAGGRPC
jgi:ABC-2 type transport system ATP-binding protein